MNLEALIDAERGLVYDVRAFEDFRRQFAVDVARQYFNLLTRQQSVRNSQVNYENLAVLTERTIALFAAGRISFLEVQRSRQALLTAEQRVIASREQYQNSIDAFKFQIGMAVFLRRAKEGAKGVARLPRWSAVRRELARAMVAYLEYPGG